MLRGEGVGREIRAVHLVIVLDDTLQGISAMLVLALGIFVLPIDVYKRQLPDLCQLQVLTAFSLHAVMN